MKRVLAALLCLLLAFSMVLMTACSGEVPADPNGGNTPSGDNGGNEGGNQGGNQGGSQGNTHVHTFKTDADWSKDATGHWYDATCDCADVTVRKLNHVDDNKDGACDVCKYSDHEHFYSEEWTADCTNHWNAAACGCIIAGANVAAHADGDGDGACDTCNYVIEDLHKHYYATEWSSDNAYHWHAALCEHGVEVADKAAHELNAAGDCVVCGAHINEINAEDIAAVLAATQANEYKIAYGDVIAVDRVYGGTGAETLENGKTNRVHFALGNGESYIQYVSFDMNGNYIGQEEQWHEALGNDKYFAVAMLNGDYELSPIAGAAQFLNGYNYIPGSIIPSDSADTSTLANMLSALYNQMKAGTRVSNATESVEDGVYKFAYTYYSVNAHTTGGEVYNVELEYYNVTVEFTVNDDMIIDSAEFEVEVYRDYENDSDLAYTWVDNGDMTVTISDLQLKPTANPSFYNYTVAQTSGERTFTTPYPKASLIPTSFEFYYVIETAWDDNAEYVSEYEVIGDYYEIEQDTYAKFCIGEILPKTASSKFMSSDDFHFSFVNNDPNSEGQAWIMTPGTTDAMLNGYNAFSQMLKLKLRDPGEYTVTIGFGDVLKIFTLKIVGPEIPEVPETNASQIGVLVTDFDAWADHYSYTAAEAGTYTFNIPAGLGLYSDQSFNSFGDPEVQVESNTSGRAVTVEMDAGDVYGFYVSAATKNTAWTITVDFVAAEGGEGGGDDIGGGEQGGIAADISGTYVSGNLTLVINNDGTMTRTQGDYTGNYTYVIDGDTVTYTLNDNDPYTKDHDMASFYGYLTFGADGMPETFVFGGTTYPLTTGEGGEGGGEGGEGGGDEGEPDALKDSLYLQMPAYGNYNLMFITVDGEYVVNIYGEGYDLYFTYELEELSAGSYAITVAYFARPDFESGTDMVDTIEAEVFYAQYDGVEWTFGDGSGDDEGGDDQPTNIKDTLYMQMPTYGNYNLMFLTVDGEYVVNIYGEGYDLYFTYELEELSAGSYAITVAYFARPDFESGTDMVDTIEAEVFYAQYDGVEWTFGDGEGGEGGDEEEEDTSLEGSLSGYYDNALNGNHVGFYQDFDTGVYYMNVYNDTGVDMYYTYTVVDNGDGTLTITPTFAPDHWMSSNTTDEFALEGKEITATSTGDSWTFAVAEGEDDDEVLEGSGSLEDAYVADNSNTVAYPGGTAYSFFSYTVAADGTMTITFTGDNFYWMYGDGATTYVEMGTEASATFDVTEGQVIYIGITTANGEAGTVTFEIDAPEAELPEEPAGPTGTFADPFELQENNSCAFPGGWNYIFYKYTATEAGTLTITVSGNDFYWAYGYGEYEMNNVGNNTATADITLAAGETVYIGMSTNSYAAATIDFTASFVAGGGEGGEEEPTEPDGTFANPFELQENNSCAFPGGYNYLFYKYTATEAGTLTITVSGNDFYWAYGYGEYEMNNVGNNTATADITLAAGETVYIGMSTNSTAAATIDFTASFTAGAAGGEEPVVNETPMAIGNNAINGADVTFAYTADADITLKVELAAILGSLEVTYSVNGNAATALAANSSVEITLAAGDKLVVASVGNGYSTVIVTEVVSGGDEGGDEGDEDDGLEGSGTSTDPWIIDAAPWSYTLTGAHDKYFKFTATEKCTVTVVVPAGCAAFGLSGSYTYDANENKVYSFVMEAGAEFTMNAYRASGSADYTYTMTTEAYVEPEPGEGGGEVTGVVSYVGANGSGRAMKVTIDAAAGTMSVIRAALAGNSLDLATGATEAVYTYAFDGTTVTTTLVSGQSCTFTFDANGAPVSVIWGSATYTNFTAQ